MLRWTGGSKTRADVANVQGGGGWGGGPLSCLSDKKRSPIGHDFSSSGIKEGRHARVRSSLDALINHTATGFAPHSRQRHHCRSVDVLGLTMAMENNNYNNKDTILRVARRPNDEANQAQKPQGGASSLVAPASHPITAKKLRHYETTTTTTTDNNSLFSSSFKAPGSSSSSCSSPPTSVGAVASSGRSMAWGVTTGNYEGSPPSSGLPVEHRGGGGGGGYEEDGTHRCFFTSMVGGGRDNNAVTDYRPFMFRQGDTTMDAVVVDVHEEDDTNTDDGVIEMPLHPPQRRRQSTAASSFPFYFSIDAAADASCYSTRSGGSRPVFWVPSPHASHVLTQQQQQQSSLPTSWHEEEEGGDCLFSDIDQNYRHDRQQHSGFAHSGFAHSGFAHSGFAHSGFAYSPPPPPPPLFALPHHHHFSFSSPSFVIL